MFSADSFFNDKNFNGVALILAKDFTILKANDLFLQLNGYKEEEIKRIKFIDMIIPKEKSFFMDVLYNNILTQDITIQLYHKSGAFRFYSMIVLTFENYFVVLGNEIKKEFTGYDYQTLTKELKDVDNIFKGLDIIDIKELFEDQNPALNFVLDVLPIDVWIKDRYAKYVYCNDTFTVHTGHTREDLRGKSDFELFERDIAQEFVKSDNKVIESRMKLSYIFESKSEKLLTWTEVTKIPLFNKNGVYIGIIGFSVDISEQKNMEMVYNTKQERIDNVLQNIPGFVCEIGPRGEVYYMSGKLSELFDNDHEFAAYKFIWDKDDVGLKEKIRVALAGKEVHISTSLKDVLIDFTLTPVPNNEGSFNLIGVGNIAKEDE